MESGHASAGGAAPDAPLGPAGMWSEDAGTTHLRIQLWFHARVAPAAELVGGTAEQTQAQNLCFRARIRHRVMKYIFITLQLWEPGQASGADEKKVDL